MPKLRRMSGREICAILESQGFAFIRQKGSHRVMQRRLPNTTVTAIVPDHDQVKVGTLLSIIRQSQLPRELFEN